MKALFTSATLLALYAGGLLAQEPALGPVDGEGLPPTDIERVAVGMEAPDWTLARHAGGTVTLSDFRGEKNLVLVFFRGWWCPYCIAQLTELRSVLDEEMKTDTEIIVLSIDGVEETGRTIQRISQDGTPAEFIFAMDPDHAVIDRYGLLNPDAGRRMGVPHPAAYVIDKDGVVRWRDVQTDYTIRPTNQQIRDAVAEVRGG